MCTTAQPCQIMLCTRLVYSCNVTPRQRGSNAFLSFAPSLLRESSLTGRHDPDPVTSRLA